MKYIYPSSGNQAGAKPEITKMKLILTTSQSINYLLEDNNASWTYDMAKAIVEYIEELEKDMRSEIEFDRVQIRCDFAAYGSALECYLDDYHHLLDDDEKEELGAMTEADAEALALEWLEKHTTVLPFEGGIVIRQF